ncbi:MAG: hypothetical protein IK090_05175 [Clostridia bacterium]|nr:hypothetical protein [Clostridia bacterium]
MNDQWNGDNREGREEPERVYIPYAPPPRREPRKGGGFDTTALIMAILSVVFASCLAPVSIALSILSFVFLRRYRAQGGEWRGTAVASALLAGLGILFSVLAAVLIVVAFVTKDSNSLYGLLYQIEL